MCGPRRASRYQGSTGLSWKEGCAVAEEGWKGKTHSKKKKRRMDPENRERNLVLVETAGRKEDV